MGTLYAELGGAEMVERIVDLLYERILADPALSPYFDGIEMVRQRHKFRMFLNTITGGPGAVSALELRASHAHAVDHGLNADHFDTFVKHFESAMTDAGVKEDVADQILGRIVDFQAEILGW